MDKLKDQLLKKELEYQDQAQGYSQWILGTSIKEKLARVVVKTNESLNADGMDIGYKQLGDKLSLDDNYYENSLVLWGVQCRMS